MALRRGLALILVVGVLGVLAVLGSAFAVLSRLERRAAAQRVYGTRAFLLARSGLEDAQARLDAGQDPEYAGEDFNDDRLLSAGLETEGQVYQCLVLNRDDCPAAQALRPSFFKAVGANPRYVLVDGRARGISGELSGDRATWSLKVLAGGFYVNDANPQLRRILGTLAEAVGRQDGSPVAQADGEALIDLRPGSGWTSYEQIRDLALGGSQAKLDALAPYLTLAAWVDRKVIRPNVAYTAPVIHSSWETLKRSHGGAPGFEARAPVDLAWARTHRPALIALLANLRGVWVDEWDLGGVGKAKDATIALDWAQPTDDCRTAADWILASTTELRTWEQWNAFCDGVPMTGTSDLPAVKRALLQASFNPNTDANKLNPDVSMDKPVDKSDLLAWSTEFSLAPLGGERIASVGRVLDAQGRLLASRTLSARRAPDRAFRLTTQGELVAGDLGRPDVAGDEADWRTYGEASFITPSRGNGGKTFGHRFPGLDPGMSLQTGPEPHTVAVPASWDGQLRLATTETADGEDYLIPSVPARQLFLAGWDDGFDADHFGGSPAVDYWNGPGGTPTAALPVWDSVQPGVLYPDGHYVERGTWGQPGFASPGNMAAHTGTLSIWLKPDYDIRKRIRGHCYWENSRDTFPLDSGMGCFYLIHIAMESSGSVQQCWCHWGKNVGGDLGENQCMTPNYTPTVPARWYLLTFTWDVGQPNENLCARILVDRGLPANPKDRDDTRSYGVSTHPSPTVDFRDGGQQRFCLGPNGEGPGVQMPNAYAGLAQATLDEFAIYDFGPMTGAGGPADAIELSEKMAQARFKAGRFYKESDYFGLGNPGNKAGEWFSAPIDLGRVRLRSLAWTQIVPRGLRSPEPEGWPSPPDPVKPEDGDPGPDGRIALELVRSDTAYLVDTLFTDSRGQTVLRPSSGAFRFHAVFQPNLFNANGEAANRAILDPLVLDDITLTYRDPVQGAFGAWREGE